MASEEDKDKTGEDANTEGNEDKEHDDADDTDEGGEEDSSGGDEGDEGSEDNKPITKKELKNFGKQIVDSINAGNRRNNKNQNRSYKNSDSSKGDRGERDYSNDARIDAIEISNRKRDFGYDNQLSPKEVELVWKYANGKPSAKTLDDPFIKGGLESLRRKSNLRDNTPSGAAASTFEVGDKKVKFGELKTEEKQKNFQAHQQNILAGKRR